MHIRRKKCQNYTQEYVADELGITALAYGNIERGTSFPNSKRIQEIAKVLEVEPQELFSDSDAVNILAPVHNSSIGVYNNQNTIGVTEKVLENTNQLLERMVTVLEQLSKKLNTQ